MNPVTQALLKDLDRPEVSDFVSRWDMLEAGLIALYRGEEPQEPPDQVRAQLLEQHPRWSEQLAPHWQSASGARIDPFEAILERSYPETKSVSWGTLQLLPAAREALNGWILSLLHHREH